MINSIAIPSETVKTVNAHVEHILAKLGVSRRAEIAAWAATLGVGHRA